MRHTRSRLAFTAASVVLLAGVTSAPAYAQAPSPATDQYGTKVARVSVAEAQPQPATDVHAELSTLPDTGMSLLGMVIAGGALIATGVVLRRRDRRQTSALDE